jgi:hypothetical protein
VRERAETLDAVHHLPCTVAVGRHEEAGNWNPEKNRLYKLRLAGHVPAKAALVGRGDIDLVLVDHGDYLLDGDVVRVEIHQTPFVGKLVNDFRNGLRGRGHSQLLLS